MGACNCRGGPTCCKKTSLGWWPPVLPPLNPSWPPEPPPDTRELVRQEIMRILEEETERSK